jgi:hypothetical protein
VHKRFRTSQNETGSEKRGKDNQKRKIVKKGNEKERNLVLSYLAAGGVGLSQCEAPDGVYNARRRASAAHWYNKPLANKITLLLSPAVKSGRHWHFCLTFFFFF